MKTFKSLLFVSIAALFVAACSESPASTIAGTYTGTLTLTNQGGTDQNAKVVLSEVNDNAVSLDSVRSSVIAGGVQTYSTQVLANITEANDVYTLTADSNYIAGTYTAQAGLNVTVVAVDTLLNPTTATFVGTK